ncbi:hypothetical protein OIU77_010106 [Salix suchowensis]|uniref:Uncharacterized protein n=1 Tax=Salix suchowensis TaxID=1278906 RepID=A0ABQ9A797_9ROSI|nr:hypothetical protein OIU77_010106 [Salix suchowensis]
MLYPFYKELEQERGRSGRLREICGGWGSRLKWFQSKGCWLFGGRSYTGKEVGCGVADAGFSGGGEQEREEEQLWVVTVKETDMREMEGKKLMAGEGNCSPAVGRRLGSGEGGNGEAGDWRREKDSF